MEQRLSLYLAKKFVSQKLHRRYVDDLARALPIEEARPDNVRRTLQRAALGLLEKRVSILGDFALEKSRNGRWVAAFRRRAAPQQQRPLPRYAAENLAPQLAELVDRITETVGDRSDRLWWTQCVKRLGSGAVNRALGQLKEARQLTPVKNPGGLLAKILKDIATERGIVLH